MSKDAGRLAPAVWTAALLALFSRHQKNIEEKQNIWKFLPGSKPAPSPVKHGWWKGAQIDPEELPEGEIRDAYYVAYWEAKDMGLEDNKADMYAWMRISPLFGTVGEDEDIEYEDEMSPEEQAEEDRIIREIEEDYQQQWNTIKEPLVVGDGVRYTGADSPSWGLLNGMVGVVEDLSDVQPGYYSVKFPDIGQRENEWGGITNTRFYLHRDKLERMTDSGIDDLEDLYKNSRRKRATYDFIEGDRVSYYYPRTEEVILGTVVKINPGSENILVRFDGRGALPVPQAELVYEGNASDQQRDPEYMAGERDERSRNNMREDWSNFKPTDIGKSQREVDDLNDLFKNSWWRR